MQSRALFRVLCVYCVFSLTLLGCPTTDTPPSSDVAGPGSLHDTVPSTEVVQPGADGAQPGADGAQPGVDGAQPGVDGGSPGADGGSPGADGGSPGADGGAPGADGGQPGGDVGSGCVSDANCAPKGTVCEPLVCVQGACVPGDAEGAPCDDQDPCTSGDACAAGECTGEPVLCDDGDPCTDDACVVGECAHVPGAECPCTADADCAGTGAVDLCAAARACVDGACAEVPDTAVVCPTEDDTECATRLCDSKTGECSLTPTHEGEPCGVVPCEAAGTCVEGVCADLVSVDCNDGDPCTDDGCDPATGCTHAPSSGAPCDDGSACTAGDLCEAGACAGAPLTCSDDDPCTDDGCDPATGCIHASSSGAPCDDGDACTAADTCQTGACGGAAIPCDDGDPCSVDGCDPGAGCTHDPASGAACDDGSACTAGDVCVDGACAGALVGCDDDEPCTDDGCDPQTGCAHAPRTGVVCDDGSACTSGDACLAGACVGAPVSCDDGDPCTDDDCDTAGGCTHAPTSGGSCDDGSLCTADDACDVGACVGAAIPCDDGDACTADGCDPAAGCTHAGATGGVCDDGSLCTADDACDGGACVGVPVGCDDGDPCTEDGCSEESGCLHAPHSGGACNDGSSCTVDDTCVDGACHGTGVPCTDDDPCTDDVCDAAGGCTHVPRSDVPCNDGLACTAADVCTDGACAGVAVSCDDGDPCTDDSCDPASGCVHAPATGAPCDDGSPCTVGDACQDGACAPGPSACACETDADCEPYDDGDPCTGALHCDTSGGAPACVPDPATVVVCPPVGENPCVVSVCDPADGQCKTAPSGAGEPCDDGSKCTTGDACQDGVCLPGALTPCNDKNPCTSDMCDPVAGCVHTPTSGGCTDGSLCTSADSCVDGACVPGPVVGCDDGSVCTTDSCDPAVGCVTTPAAGPCEDGSACTTGDTCEGGLCTPGAAVSCDDHELCTADACDPAKGCVHASAPGPCDDGSACTAGDACLTGACKPGAPVGCDDGEVCTTDSCDPAKGCTHTAAAGPCSDGSACTSDDTCADGACAPGAAVPCDDGNLCTADSCDPATGCVHAPSPGPCSDGSACTEGDSCNGSACAPGAPVACDDGEVCTADGCDPATGCTHAPAAGPCEDGSACTSGDACADGACVSGAAIACDDGNVCTTDVCDPAAGCVHPPVGGPCDDGSACTAGDACANGACAPGAPVACDDGEVCTADGCDPATGCTHSAAAGPCSDGSACTAGDACADGACAPGAPVACDDGEVCTADGCDPATGCTHSAAVGPCDDGDACTGGDACADGVCTSGAPVDCDDQTSCTADSCDGATGCVHAPDDASCDDGNACTVDVCDQLVGCQSTPLDCDDGNACTDELGCDPATGCLRADNDLVYGTCSTGHPGACGPGTWHCQDGEGYCFPAVEGLGEIETVPLPDGLLERYGATTAVGEVLLTSNGEYLVNVAHGLAGVVYAGWTWRLIDPRNGFATVLEMSVPDESFYADGVVADATHFYAIEWTGAGYGRVRAVSLTTGEIADAGTPNGDWTVPQAGLGAPISGQFDWANGQVFLGGLDAPTAWRWTATPWQPLHTPPPSGNAAEVLALQGVAGAGVLTTDGTWLYVKRWAGYPGDDELRRIGSGFGGTTAGAYGGRMTLNGPLAPSLTAAYHSDGYVYNARYDGGGLQRVRVSAATPEVCDGADNDCDGSADESCHPPNDHCIHAVAVGDGASALDTTGATSGGPPVTGCGPGTIEDDVWVEYTATCNGKVQASLCSADHDALLAVYEGGACPPGAPMVCAPAACDGEGVTFEALAGQTFLLRVGGASAGDVGASTVALSCGTSCGDGVLDPTTGEECDDGAHYTNDGCDATCHLETCGDGIVQDMLYEVCDDGAQNSDSVPGACRTNCQKGDCGDGVKVAPEECDLGASNSDTAKDGCRTSCALASCGDGVVDTGEACDDGNRDSSDGCGPTCALETCGDGLITGAETCDDGGQAPGDGCSASCQNETCGDGVVQAALGEQCDDGPNGSGTCTDTCTTIACTTEVCDAADNDCDGAVDEGCASPVVAYTLAADAGLSDPPVYYKPLPTTCGNLYDCNDGNTYTTDDCVNGACVWTYIPCDGPDADSCTDGRHLTQTGACIDTGPILLWDFEDALDGAVLDLSGNGAHGIPKGGAIDAAGKHGKAFSTAAAPGLISKPTLLPATDFTFTAWFKTTAVTGGILAAVGQGAVGDPATPTDREMYLTGGRLAYRVSPGASSQCTGQGPLVNDGAWHHAALVCQKGMSCRLLLDGAPLCESLYFDAQSKLPNQTAFVAGWSQAGGAFTGLLDHVALFGYPMTGADVAHLMATGVLTAAEGSNMERCNDLDMDCNGQVDDTCTNSDLCSPVDTCTAGNECVASTTTSCPGPSTTCAPDVCDKTTGVCGIANAAAGASCDDGLSCTTNDVCDGAGTCVGSNTQCGSGTAWFPAGVVREDGKDLGKDIIIYDMKGAPKLGCIVPLANELGAFATWKPVQGTTNSYTHQGPVGFGIATPKGGANMYECAGIWWVLTTDLTVGLEPFTMGGKITVPFPDVGFSQDMALSPPPVSVNAPYLALGVQSGASLSYLGAPLQPDRDYWFLSGLFGAHLRFGSALPIPFPGSKSVSIVIDPFDPLFYLGLEDLVKFPVGPTEVSLEGIGISNGGKLLHKSLIDMWFGETKTGPDQLTKLVFDPVTNNAHGYVQASVAFQSEAVPEVTFKVTGQVSVGLDAKGDGFDSSGGADTIWNAMIVGAPAGNDKQKDVRTLVVGNLAFQMPLKRKNKDGESVPVKLSLNGKEFPVNFGFALAQAALLFDTSPGDEVVALRARTTKMPWEGIPVLKDLLASFNFKLDVAGYWKRLAGANSGGFAIEVVTPTPIKVPVVNRAIPFRGLLIIDSAYGVKLQGSFDFGKFSWFGADFDLGTLGPVEASYDGEKFCLGAAVTVPKSFEKEGGGTETTTCKLIPCFGEHGFDGSTVTCDPYCFTHSECAAGEACIWGTCQPPLANAAACSNDVACKSGRCYAGFCVECWPGSSECSGTDFCDEAGYCQGQLDNGVPCVSVHNGISFSRHDWCKSGKCDSLCVECLPRGPLHQPSGPFAYTETCPSGTFCDSLGACQPLIPGGATCFNPKQAMGVDAWCEFGDCNDTTAICQDCGPDTSNTCDSNHYCLGYGCQPRVDDDTACLLPEACKSGTCGVGVVAGTGSWCYTADSKSYDQSCKVSAACKSGGCRLTDNKCGCNGDHSLCNTSTQY